MKVLAANLKKIRGVKGWSQQEMADFMGVSRASIGSYEEERALPKLEILLLIAQKLQLTLDALVTAPLKVDDITGFKPHAPASGQEKTLAKELEPLMARLNVLSTELDAVRRAINKAISRQD